MKQTVMAQTVFKGTVWVLLLLFCIFLREFGWGGGGGNAVELRMEEIRVEEEPVSPPITDT